MSTDNRHQPGQPAGPAGDGDPLQLCAADAAALDALVDAAFRPEAVPPQHAQRARALARALGLLDVREPIGSGDTLVNLTLARVARLDSTAAQPEAVLVPDDEDALEALVASGFNPQRVPGAVRERAARFDRLLSLLTAPVPNEPAADDLVNRTLARVQLAIDQHEQRMVIQTRAGGWGRVRIGDLVSIAALLVIAGALVGPMVLGVREHARRLACQTNMSGAAAGFSLYANDYRDRLPMATPSIAGNPWWNVGKNINESNSANLYVLTRTSHTKLADLACPGNGAACTQPDSPDDADWRSIDNVSYSYQSMFARQRPSWNATSTAPRTVVLSDASPVVRRAVRGQLIYPFENSLNHLGRGQSVLFNDGSVEWLKTPVLANNDNIWLPRQIETIIAKMTRPTQAEPIKGNEIPESGDDVLLGP